MFGNGYVKGQEIEAIHYSTISKSGLLKTIIIKCGVNDTIPVMHMRMRTARRGVYGFILTLCVCLVPGLVQARAGDILIRDGYVMTFDPALGDIEGGDVRIRDGRIHEVGRDLDAEGAQVIEAKGAVVLPGFVDTHSHLWITTMRGQFRNGDEKFFPVSSKLAGAMTAEDIHTAMYTGAVELIHGGITTTADFFDNVLSRDHGEAGARALEDAGVRAILFYGGPDKTTKSQIDLEHLEALARRHKDRVRLGLAWRLPRQLDDAGNWAMRQREYDTARQLGLPMQVHVSGQPGPMFDALIARGYLYPGLTVVHATDASPAQLEALKAAGGSLALTPLSEHRVAYGLTRIDHFASVTRQGFGIDGNALAGSADMFATMRLAALTWSGGARDEAAPSPRALLELATRRGAEAVGLGEETGTLTPGKRADIQIIDLGGINFSGFGGGDPAALLVYSGRPENVREVFVDGHLLKHNGRLTGVDAETLQSKADASARSLLQRAAQ